MNKQVDSLRKYFFFFLVFGFINIFTQCFMLDFNYLQVNRNGKRKRRTKQEIKLKIKIFVELKFGYSFGLVFSLGWGKVCLLDSKRSFHFLFFQFQSSNRFLCCFLSFFCSVGTG